MPLQKRAVGGELTIVRALNRHHSGIIFDVNHSSSLHGLDDTTKAVAHAYARGFATHACGIVRKEVFGARGWRVQKHTVRAQSWKYPHHPNSHRLRCSLSIRMKLFVVFAILLGAHEAAAAQCPASNYEGN